MGFDWQAFATGFMESRVKSIEKKEDEASAFEERQRELAERNAQTISRRRAVAQQVSSLTNMLRDSGASDRIIQAAIAAGPKEITVLANKVAEARKATGGKLNASDIEALVNVPEGFSAVDLSTEELINQTYGLGYDRKGVSQELPKRTFMDRLKGDKLMDRARARLDSEILQDGLTAYDINQIAAQQDYESLVPGTFITFNDMQVFNPAKDMSSFTRTISALISDVQGSPAYESVTREIEQAKFSTGLSEEERAERIQRLTAERDALFARTAGPTIEAMVKTYGETFLDATEGYLRGFMSDAYVDNLMTRMDDDEEDTTASVVDDLTAATMGAVTGEAPTATSITTPEVVVTELDPAEEVQAEEEEEEPTAEETGEAETEEDVINPATQQEYTYEEWQDMSRQEREDAGLPTSVIGGELGFKRFLTGITGKDYTITVGDSEEPIEKVASVREKAAEKLGITPEKFQDAMDRGVLTELDLQIFADHADDIAEFIESGDYELTPEGISVGLSDWAQESGNILPFDKSFLVQTLNTALGD